MTTVHGYKRPPFWRVFNPPKNKALAGARDAAAKAVALDSVRRAASLARARARAALLCSVKWDEAQHPRNELGRFTEDGGGDVVHAVAGFDDLPKAQQDYVTREAHRWGVDEHDLVQRGSAILEAAQGHPGDNGAGWYAERQRDAQAYAERYGLSTEQVHGVIAALSPQTRWDNKDGGHPNLLHAEVVMGLWQQNPNLNGVPFRDALRDDIKGALTDARDQGWLHDQYGAVMRGNAENAFEILQGKDPADVLEGNKTRSFFEQMRTGGKSDSATIDVWMMAALSGREPADQGGPRLPSSQLDIHVLDRGKTEDRGKLASGWVPNAGVYSVFDQSVRDIAAAHNMSVADAQAMIWTQVRDHGLPDSLVVKAEPKSSNRNTSPRGSGIPFIYDWTGEDPDFIDDPDGDLEGIIADVVAMVRRHTQGPAFKVFDEGAHPRDEHGKFTDSGSGIGARLEAGAEVGSWDSQPRGDVSPLKTRVGVKAAEERLKDKVTPEQVRAAGFDNYRDVIKSVHDQWYETSNQPAIQIAASNVFGIKSNSLEEAERRSAEYNAARIAEDQRIIAGGRPNPEMEEILGPRSPEDIRADIERAQRDIEYVQNFPSVREDLGPKLPVYEAAVRAIYETTQEHLAQQGITSMELYRGYNWRRVSEDKPQWATRALSENYRTGGGRTGLIDLRPLASFSADPNVAEKYADRMGTRGLGAVISGTVPADRIFSLPKVGVGGPIEKEVVVIGGSSTWNVWASGRVKSFGVDKFKWDESEHPRDERGRFGSGDGGALRLFGDEEGMAPDAAALRAAEQRITAVLPDADVSLRDMDPHLAGVVAEHIERFAAEYPAAARSLVSVSTEVDEPNVSAYVQNWGGDANNLVFNTLTFGDRETAESLVRDGYDNGFHPYATVEAVIDHELGHVIDNHLFYEDEDSAPSTQLWHRYEAVRDEESDDAAVDDMREFLGQDRGYILEGGPKEAWGELYAMKMNGIPMADTAAQLVDRALAAEREYKRRITWTRPFARAGERSCRGFFGKPSETKVFNEEDHPRNELGRFTDSGASAEGFDVMQHAAVNFGGFSVHPMTGDVPKTGFQVAIPGHALDPLPTVEQWASMDDDAGAAMVAQWMEANAQAFAQPNVYVGGWVDGGRVYLEPSQRVEDRAEAVRLGVERGQKSIWSNADGAEINTGDTAAKSDRDGLAAQGVVGDDRRGEGRVLPRGVRADEGWPDQVQLKDFDEDAHPRDERGRFSSGGGAPAGPVAGRDYQLTYKPNIGGRAERSALVRFRGVVDRGGGPTARFTVLDDPNHAIDTTTQLDLYLSASQLVALEARNDVPVRDSADVTMHAWAEEHPAGTVYRAMSMDEVNSVRAGGQLGPPSGGNQLWVSSTPTMEYVDRGEVIGAIRTQPGEIEAGMPGGPGDWMLPHLPGDRLIDVWKPPADAPLVPYHLRGRLDTKFEEEQHPRDERGRFSSGGASLEGRAERLSDNPKDWKLHLEQAFPNAEVLMVATQAHGPHYAEDFGYRITTQQLTERSVAIGKGTTAALLDMAAKYPDAAAQLESIRMFPGMLKGAAAAEYWPGPFNQGGVYRDGPAIFVDPERIATSLTASVAGQLGDESHTERENFERLGYGITVHEFGHHIDQLQSHGSPYTRDDMDRIYREGRGWGRSTASDAFHGESAQERSDDHISGYAQTNPHEYFAELFAANTLHDQLLTVSLNDADRAALDSLTVKAQSSRERAQGSVCDGTFTGSVVWQLLRGGAVAETKSMVDPTDTRGGKAITKRYEAELGAILNRHLHRQQAVILQRLKGPKARQRTRHWSPPGERKIDAEKVVGADRWRNELMDDARPLLVRLYQQSGDATNRAIFASMGVRPEDFDVESPSVADMIKARVDLIGDASTTLTARIRDQIARGEEAGEDIGTIADRVLATYGDTEEWWADRIAGDEVHAGQMGAAHAAVLASGLDGQREWVSVGDDRVRPAHVEADGQKVGVDEPFQVGGEELMYPGDPSGSPELVINCRCVVGYDFRAPEGAPTAEEAAQLHVEGLAAKLYDEAQHPRDERGRWTDAEGNASETATMLADVPRFVPNEPGDRPGYRDANDRAIAAFVERNGPEAQRYVDLIKGWTDIGSSQLSRAAVDGSTARGRELAHYLDQAPTHADPLYRGTSALHLEPGFEFQLRPSSFTHDEGTGDHYALQMAGKGASAHPAVLEVLGGSRGLPVDALGKYPEEHEVISGGTFRVVSSEPKEIPGYGNPITVEHIVVEQIKPPLKSTDPGWWRPTRRLTAAEEEMSGTFAEVRDEGEIKLARLRDLLATKPPERRASS